MKKHRFLICGGRAYKDQEEFNKTIQQLRPYLAKGFCLIHGGANGADKMAHVWAFYEGCPVIQMLANWDFYENAAGHIRNSWMLKYAAPDLVVAFPGGSGTADMVKQAKNANVDVWEVNNGEE